MLRSFRQGIIPRRAKSQRGYSLICILLTYPQATPTPMTSRYQISGLLHLEMSQELVSGECPVVESCGKKGRGSLKEVNESNTLMKDIIDEVIFKMQDGRKVKVSEYGGSWTQYGVTQDEMLSPQFLEELWKLLLDWQMIDAD